MINLSNGFQIISKQQFVIFLLGGWKWQEHLWQTLLQYKLCLIEFYSNMCQCFEEEHFFIGTHQKVIDSFIMTDKLKHFACDKNRVYFEAIAISLHGMVVLLAFFLVLECQNSKQFVFKHLFRNGRTWIQWSSQ